MRLKKVSGVLKVKVVGEGASCFNPVFQDNLHRFGLHFLPCVEVAGDKPFLTERPQTLLQSGKYNKVPVINGVVNKEGLLALSSKYYITPPSYCGVFEVN